MGSGRRSGLATILVAAAIVSGACGGNPGFGQPADTSNPVTDVAPAPSGPTTSAPTLPTTSQPTAPHSLPSDCRASTPGRTTSTGSTASGPGPLPAAFPPGLAGKDLEVMPTTRPVVALTFDAGSNATGAASIVATLRATNSAATFFLTGAFTTNFPSIARQLAAGYRIGNHTQNHLSLTTLDDTAVRNEVTAAEKQIRAVTSVDPRPWFRFPFGDRNARTIADANLLGYAAIRWTVDSLGWKGTSGGQSATSVRDRVLAAARPGEIVLMHIGANPDDGTTLDADALPSIIAGFTSRGYTPVTLDTLLN